MLQLRLLGSPEISLGEVVVTETLSAKAQAILYYLAVTGPSGQPRSMLATLLWGDVPDEAARVNLRKALSNVREVVGSHLDLESQTVAFKPGSSYWVDVKAFQAACAQGQADSSLNLLRNVVDLYRGDFLTGYYVRNAPDFETWMLAEQARLRELMIQALQTLATGYPEQGDLALGISYVRRLLAMEPWREEAHRQLMRLLAQDGQRGAALAQYEACRQALAGELGVEPGAETVALYQRIREGNLGTGAGEQRSRGEVYPPAPLRPSTPAPRHNLPPQPTPFIGRKSELADILRRLLDRECRLLTLVGPGGMGKTRTALQVAQAIADTDPEATLFAHGIFFTPLAAVSSPSGMIAAIAQAINFNFSGILPPRQQLLDHLREKEMLLLLDNFEHLPADVDLIADILTTAHKVKLLLTSREAVNLYESWFHPLAGLSYPPSPPHTRGKVWEGVETYDAVRLFEQCARRARIDFSLAAEQAHVLRICQLVEGMPLGIELAAAWLRVLPIEKIAQELARGLDILSTRLQNIPERHRSMRVVFEQSWSLLTPEERAIFKQLSVFRGSFDQAAAEHVAGAALVNLAILVEKSLLSLTETGRYHMHELLRQFAAEKLAESPPEQQQLQFRHCVYYAHWLEERDAWLRTKQQLEAVRQISADLENIQVAWQRAVDQGEAACLSRFMWSLWFVYEAKSWFHAGAELFGGAAAQLSQLEQSTDPEQQRIYAQLLAFQGRFLLRLHRLDQAIRLMAQSTPRLQQFQAYRDLGLAYKTLGLIARVQGHYPAARDYFEQSVIMAEKGDDLLIAAFSRSMNGFVAFALGENSLAEQLLQQSLPILRKLGKLWGLVLSLAHLSSVLSALGQYSEAEKLLLEGLEICREVGDRWAIADSYRRLGALRANMAETNQAETKQLLVQGVAIFREIDDRWGLTNSLNQLGHTCGILGEYEAARQYLNEAIQTARQSGLTPIVLDALVNLADLYLQAQSPPSLESQTEAMGLLALVINHPASEQATKNRAVYLLAAVESELPADAITAAITKAKEQSLEAVVATQLMG